METLLSLVLLLGALVPAKGWFTPTQPIEVTVKDVGADARLVLADFSGRLLEPSGPAEVGPDATVNVREIFPQLVNPGTYVLFVTKKGAPPTEFEGTPLVIGVRENRKRRAPPGPMVVRVEPLRYAVMQAGQGASPITLAFYYDVAPNTVANFLSLAEEGYFDGITFHRIEPDFVIQGGDPRGDGTGGPGYLIDAEFNDRPHEAGALSMARTSDPGEGPGVMPRSEFANSAASQFFISLNYENTRSLDRKYTVFGKVVEGMEVVNAIASTPLADERTGQPREPQVIKKVEVKPVTAAENPYTGIIRLEPPASTDAPATPADAPASPPAPKESPAAPAAPAEGAPAEGAPAEAAPAEKK